jgi:PTS system ascorbate-specific IIC component
MNALVRLLVSIFGNAATMIGIIAAVGLIAQKASIERVLGGALKAFLGMIIMGAGAGVIVGMLGPMADIMAKAFGFQGIVPVNEAITALATTKFGMQMAIITVGGFAVNVILARLTPLRYIFLSGHHILVIATVCTAMLFTLGLPNIMVLIYGSIISGIVMTMMPAFSMPFMHKATKGAGFAMGHLATAGYCAAGMIGKWVGGDPEKTDSEKMEFSGKLSFFRESLLLMGLGVAVVYLIAVIFAGTAFVGKYAGTTDPFVWSILQAFTFAAGVAVILLGVRMFVGEIVPAFRGISDKLVPGAIPALDCPAVFPYGPNSVLVGFFGYTVGLVIMMVILLVIKYPVAIIPVLFHSFFMGGTAGVFGNATGGRRGAFLGAGFQGFINSLLQAVLFVMMAGIGFKGTTFADTDFLLTGIIIGKLGSFMPLVLLVFVAFFAFAVWVELKITRPMLAASPKAE